MSSPIKVTWVDGGREPTQKPNPAFPHGVHLDASAGAEFTCKTSLPYPAKRCGHYVVACTTCGLSIVITTAGRRDDPRTVKLACNFPKPPETVQ